VAGSQLLSGGLGGILGPQYVTEYGEPECLFASVLPSFTWGLSAAWQWCVCCVFLPHGFWYWLTGVVLDKGPLNGFVVVVLLTYCAG